MLRVQCKRLTGWQAWPGRRVRALLAGSRRPALRPRQRSAAPPASRSPAHKLAHKAATRVSLRALKNECRAWPLLLPPKLSRAWPPPPWSSHSHRTGTALASRMGLQVDQLGEGVGGGLQVCGGRRRWIAQGAGPRSARQRPPACAGMHLKRTRAGQPNTGSQAASSQALVAGSAG